MKTGTHKLPAFLFRSKSPEKVSLCVQQFERYQFSKKPERLNLKAISATFEQIFYRDKNDESGTKLLAMGAKRTFVSDPEQTALDSKSLFRQLPNSWLFGGIAYDFKNQLHGLHSKNEDVLAFPELLFFEPVYLFEWNQKELRVLKHPDKQEKAELDSLVKWLFEGRESEVQAAISPAFIPPDKEQYVKTVQQIKQHIQAGDVYELNYCIQFLAHHSAIDPAIVFEQLNEISEAPFATFFKWENHYLISASPERFIQKKAGRIISQPIKGTIRRSEDPATDTQLKEQLVQDKKERSENVMIVDLVRNDLSKIAKRGSVQVTELFGLHSFKQVHQLISTVEADLKPETSLYDILEACFPMGSMTGAPKYSAMQLIDRYEHFKRGMYSGALGYLKPDGDFDFSVVIRSILHNAKTQTTGIQVGSAITIQADPAQEYRECLLKAKALFLALGSSPVEE